MDSALGPRTLQYRSSDGRVGEIIISIERQPDNVVDFGDDAPIRQPTYMVIVQSDWFSWNRAFPGMDELQSIFRCMWLSDIYISKICRDNGYELYAIIPGDITNEYDVFKS